MKRQILRKSSPKEEKDNLFYFTLLRILILVFVAMLIGSMILTYFFNLDIYRNNLRHQTETAEAIAPVPVSVHCWKVGRVSLMEAIEKRKRSMWSKRL